MAQNGKVENLVPLNKRTKAEQREIQKNGGVASGESRRRKRSLREAADRYLSLPVANRRRRNQLAREGLSPEEIDNQMAVIAGLTREAAAGNARAAKVLFDLFPEDVAPAATAAQSQEDDPITRSLKEESGYGLF